jgi:hypothetical protein
MFNYLPYSSHITPVMTSQDTVTISQTGPTIAEGPTKLRVRRKPPPPIGSVPPRENRARDKVTKGMASSWHFLVPHRGDPTSSSFVSKSQPGGFLHAPPCGLHLAIQVFPIGICLGESTLVWSYGDLLALAGSHPSTVTQAPLRS